MKCLPGKNQKYHLDVLYPVATWENDETKDRAKKKTRRDRCRHQMVQWSCVGSMELTWARYGSIWALECETENHLILENSPYSSSSAQRTGSTFHQCLLTWGNGYNDCDLLLVTSSLAFFWNVLLLLTSQDPANPEEVSGSECCLVGRWFLVKASLSVGEVVLNDFAGVFNVFEDSLAVALGNGASVFGRILPRLWLWHKLKK